MKKILSLLLLVAVSFAWQNASLDMRNNVTFNTSVAATLANFPVFACTNTLANFLPNVADWVSVNASDNAILPFVIESGTYPSASTCSWSRIDLTPAGANDSFFIYHKNNTAVGTAQNATATFSSYMGRWSMNDNVTGMNNTANSSSTAGFQKTKWTFASGAFANASSTGAGAGSSKTFYTTTQFKLIGKSNTQYAISFWLRLGGGSGWLLVARSNASKRYAYPFALLIRGNGSMIVSTYDGATERLCNAGTGLNGTADWKHIVISRNLTAFAVYVNGTERCSLALASDVDLSNNGNWCWGGNTTAPYCGIGDNTYGNVSFDEIRVYSYNLSGFSDNPALANWIMAEYQQGQSKYSVGANENRLISFFVSPTPANSANDFTYPMVFNMSTGLEMDSGYLQLDGTNYSCTVASDNLSCDYTPPYADHIFNHTYSAKGWACVDGVCTETNETRIVPYYGCGDVTASGTMLGNVSINDTDCFSITTDGISFDGAGYTITGNSPPYDAGAIFIKGRSNSNFSNFNVTGFEEGFRINSASSGNTFTDNAAYNNSYGFSFDSSYGNNLTGNTAYNNTHGFYTVDSGNIFSNNSAYCNSQKGFDLYRGSYSNLTSNAAYNNTDGFGLEFDSSYNNLTGNIAYNNTRDGFSVNNTQESGSFAAAYNNSIRGFSVVSAADLDNNIIADSAAYDNTRYGIYLECTGPNTITNVTAYNNSDGVHLYSIFISSYNNVSNSTIYHNTNYGIYLWDDNCIISNNNVYDNGAFQMFSDTGNGMGVNLIYNNIFNATGAEGVVSDNWGDVWNTTMDCSRQNIIGGNCIGGNWYSDYTGTDSDGDGIGDTSYAIAGGVSTDYLPLTNTAP